MKRFTFTSSIRSKSIPKEHFKRKYLFGTFHLLPTTPSHAVSDKISFIKAVSPKTPTEVGSMTTKTENIIWLLKIKEAVKEQMKSLLTSTSGFFFNTLKAWQKTTNWQMLNFPESSAIVRCTNPICKCACFLISPLMWFNLLSSDFACRV